MKRNTSTPMLRRFLSLALAFALVLGLLSFSPGFSASAASTTEVNIFSFNDFHGTVDNTASSSNPGMARFAAVVKKIMGDYSNTMLVAAGDNYQGSAISNYFAGAPVSEMMKELGVKYSAIGNHDYDWGPDKFAKFSADAGGLEFLAANIFLKGTNDRPDYCKPYATVELGGKKIGLVGWANTGTPTLVTAKYIADVEFRSNSGTWFVDSVKEWKAQEGWDAVIALTHGTLSGANLVGVIDGIVTGHSHSVSTSATNGIPTVQAGYNGRNLGRLCLLFDDDTGAVTVTASTFASFTNSTHLPTGQVDATVKAIYDRYFEIADPIFSQKVGVFGDTSMGKNNWANQIVYDYIARTVDPDYVLIQNSGGWRSVDFDSTAAAARKPVDYWFLNTLMPFDNEIYLFELDGEYLINLLNGQRVNGVGTTAGGVYTNVNRVGGEWYVTSSNTKIEAGTTYKVSMNDFMFTGGDNFGVVEGANSVDDKTGARPLDRDYAIYSYDTLILGIPLREAMAKELTTRWVASTVLADVRTNAASNIEGPIDYTISLEGMKKVLNASITFEVEASMLASSGLQVLASGFTALDLKEGTEPIRWTDLGNGKWQGEILLMNFDKDGFTSDVAVDIAKVIYAARKYGDATMELTKFEVVGINGNDEVVYLNSEIRTAEATTSIVKVYSIYDLNQDGVINALDLGIAQRYYQAKVGGANWDAAKVCDFNDDGVVNMLDLIQLFLQYAR